MPRSSGSNTIASRGNVLGAVRRWGRDAQHGAAQLVWMRFDDGMTGNTSGDKCGNATGACVQFVESIVMQLGIYVIGSGGARDWMSTTTYATTTDGSVGTTYCAWTSGRQTILLSGFGAGRMSFTTYGPFACRATRRKRPGWHMSGK